MRRILLLAVLATLTLGAAREVHAQVFTVANNGIDAFTINGNDNPTINVVRGQTYTFNITASGHPFWIKSVQSTGTGNAFNTGVTGNGTQNGTLTWTVPAGAPNTLFYNCQFHSNMTGQIHVTSPLATPSLATPLAAGAGLLLAGWAVLQMRRRLSEVARLT